MMATGRRATTHATPIRGGVDGRSVRPERAVQGSGVSLLHFLPDGSTQWDGDVETPGGAVMGRRVAGGLLAEEPGRVDAVRTTGGRFWSFRGDVTRGVLLDADGVGDMGGNMGAMDDIADGVMPASSSGPP